jgi:1-phosphofructokinase
MIITVTVNPCLDKTATLNKIEICELNRLSSIRVDAGGKGVNVSRFLKSLNETCITTGFVGGSNGELLTKKISQENIKTNFIRVDCETRINLKIETQHGELTEFNEPGAIVNRLQ